jgi:hypothetical protein
MRPYACCAAFGLALAANISAAGAQTLVLQPNQILVIQPNGTAITQVPVVAVSTATVQPLQTVTIETVRTVRPALRPIVSHQIVAHRTTTTRIASLGSRPLYNSVAAPVSQTVTPVVVAPVTAPGQALNLSGQFRCVEGCAGLAGTAFVTQNGWDMNLINEFGQSSRAWIDYPGHIWVQNWNEGAVYSPDGMTIQFDRGSVWRRDVELLVPAVAYTR